MVEDEYIAADELEHGINVLNSEDSIDNIEMKQMKEEKNIITISSDGIYQTEFNKYSRELTTNLKECTTCSRFFNSDDLFPLEENLCIHCFFWLNYSIENRHIADIAYSDFDIDIPNYILKYKNKHVMNPCPKSGVGSCFLCDYNNNIIIENINKKNLLGYSNKNVNNIKKEITNDDCIIINDNVLNIDQEDEIICKKIIL
jgi:hypothetical protein